MATGPHLLCLVLMLAGSARADVYLHNPRGSNNKLNEQSNNRNNANRLFDSQNNDNGGYQVGDNCQPVCQNANEQYNSQLPGAGKGTMYYYAGSELFLEWTNQHACGPESLGPNARCEMIIQYTCDSHPTNNTLRDGSKTTTITNTAAGDQDPTSGRHESYQYYSDCRARQRNRGLFTADRNMRDDIGATSTRQNENGNRYGFECPEERDYYPYWHPTMWWDVAVLTSDTSRCKYYREESENVKGRGFCSLPQYNNQAACEGGTAGGTWTETSPRNMDPPYCGPAPTTRDNHLGNIVNGGMAGYNWTLPKPPPGLMAATCVLRVRYNITTTDFNAWPTGDLDGVDSRNNDDRSPVTNNPEKDFLGLGYNRTGPLRLAMNTAQYGRTFEDRTHVWVLKERPADVDDDVRIINVNVRGRRGNIVQVYPSVEYDFVPSRFHAAVGDLLHIQWTGSDANSQGNNGNGRTSTDRSNLVQIKDASTNVPLTASASALLLASNGSFDPSLLAHFAYLNQTGCNPDEKDQDATDNCKVLNAAPAYFDGGLIELRRQGTMHFMSTRNNAFSNRSQKMTIIVGPGKRKPNVPGIIVGSVVAALVVAGGMFWVAAFWVGGAAGGGAGLGAAIIAARTKRQLSFWRRPPVHSVVSAASGTFTTGPNGMVLAVPTPPDTPTWRGDPVGSPGRSGPYNPLFAWWVNLGRGQRFLGIYGAVTLAAALDGFLLHISHLHGPAGPFYPLAKAGGYMLDFNCNLTLFPMMRNIMSWLRTTPLSEWVPLDEHITFHIVVAGVITFASAFHIAMHYAAGAQMGILKHYVIGTLPGVTGHLIVLLMIPMFVTAHNSIRRGKGVQFKKRKIGGYDLFFNVHQLYILVFVLLWIHSPSFHKWSFWPVVLFILDKLIGHLRSGREVRLLRACNETSGTDVMRIEMAIDRFHYKPGQYLYINCPAISKHEWHPFTITSAPEEAIVSVHMRTRGDWTTGLRQLLNPENLKEVDFSDLSALSRASPPATSTTRTKALSPLAPASVRNPNPNPNPKPQKPSDASEEASKKKPEGKPSPDKEPPTKTSFFGMTRGTKPRAKPELEKSAKPPVEELGSQATPASVQALSAIAAQKEENLPGTSTGGENASEMKHPGAPIEQIVSAERPAGGFAAAPTLARADAISRAPLIRVDGPYGAGSEHVVDYDTVMLVGAGIGVTPFAAVLKSIRLRWRRQAATGGPLESVFPLKVYFYWICRDRQEFNWFSWLLAELEHEDVRLSNRFEINTYMTGELNLDEVVTQSTDTAKKGAEIAWAGKKWAGRPNWKRIFKKIGETHQGKTVGVFLCGPGAGELRDMCKMNTTLGGATFDFHKENF